MTLTNGTKTITCAYSNLSDDISLERSTAATASGYLQTQVGGERFGVVETLRLSASQYADLLDIMGSVDEIYYTPTTLTRGIFTRYTFPMAVDVSIKETARVGSGPYYGIELTITARGYL